MTDPRELEGLKIRFRLIREIEEKTGRKVNAPLSRNLMK